MRPVPWGCLHQACTQVRIKMLKAASTWGSSQKRYQMLRKLTQMEHKTPLRETSEVQMKPCPAETGYTKLQMDDRNTSRRMQLPRAKFCKRCFPRHFSSAVSTNCPGKWGENSFPVKVCCSRIQPPIEGSWDNRILLDRTSKGIWDKAKKTTDH